MRDALPMLAVLRAVARVTALVAVAGLAACQSDTPPADTGEAPTEEAVVNEVETWRAQHETDYRRDWVSIAGLHFLEPGSQTVGSDPANDIVVAGVDARLGRLVLDGTSVRFEPEANADVTVDGEPVTTPLMLRDDSQPEVDELVAGDVRMVLHMSGERPSLRVRNPNGELARGFLGFTWFPIDTSYRVTGRFVRDAAPQAMKVLNTFGDLDEYDTEGVIEFTLGGQSLSLRPFTSRPNRFYIVFRDASSGTETYSAARFLYADLREDGTTVLDFNKAYNPPCAFNPYTTCPIPLKENNLPVKVLAGEKAYPVHVELPSS